LRAHASLQTDLVAKENRVKVIGFSQFVGYIFMAFGQLAGGVIYSIAPQLSFLLMLMFTVPSFAIISFMIHEPAKQEAC
jgi:cyanate permease